MTKWGWVVVIPPFRRDDESVNSTTHATAKRSDTISVTYQLSYTVDELMSEFEYAGNYPEDVTISHLINILKEYAKEECGIRPSYLGYKYDGQTVYIVDNADETIHDVGFDVDGFLNTKGIIEEWPKEPRPKGRGSFLLPARAYTGNLH